MSDSTITKDIEKLIDSVEEVSGKMDSLYSYRNIFLRGIVNGVGTFLGASILAVIFYSILVQVLGFLGLNGLVRTVLPHPERNQVYMIDPTDNAK